MKQSGTRRQTELKTQVLFYASPDAVMKIMNSIERHLEEAFALRKLEGTSVRSGVLTFSQRKFSDVELELRNLTRNIVYLNVPDLEHATVPGIIETIHHLQNTLKRFQRHTKVWHKIHGQPVAPDILWRKVELLRSQLGPLGLL